MNPEECDSKDVGRLNDHEADMVTLDHYLSAAGGLDVRPDSGPQDRGNGPRYVLTNRMNLNGILSSRILGPRESYAKYYQDLLQLTDGRIPVLAAPPAADLVAYVSSKVRTGPALLELSTASTGSQPVADQVELVEFIPFHEVQGLHLPDERSLREHVARQYNNVHPHEDLLRVSPELFDGTVRQDDVAAATRQATGDRVVVDWQRVDRVRGAENAAVLAASTPDTLERAAALLHPVDTAAGTGPTGTVQLADFLQRKRPSRSLTADDILLQTILDVLAGTDVREAWSPAVILQQIRNQLHALSLATGDNEVIAVNLATVEAVVVGEREFAPFRRTGRGLVSAKALLLVLLRQELNAILSWSAHETGADAATVQLAAVMAGMLRGLSRESVRLRTPELDDLTAGWVGTLVTTSPRSGGMTIDPPGVVHNEADSVLTMGGRAFKVVPAAQSGPAERFRALDPARQQRAVELIAAELQTHEGLTIVVRTGTVDIRSSPDADLVMTLPGDAVIERRWDLDAVVEFLDDVPESNFAALNAVIDSVPEVKPSTDI
jgi:hypothetical protein